MANEPLRACPTCLTPVTEAQLGLRDFAWVNDKLPGRVGAMDVDFLLERKGRVLVLEFKPGNGAVRGGQAITFRTLRDLGFDVWIVYGEGPRVQVDWGDGKTETTIPEVAAEVVRWFEAAGNA